MRGVGRWMMGGPKVRGDAQLQDVVKLRAFATRPRRRGECHWGCGGWAGG